MVRDSLYRHLSTDAGVSAIVADRIFPVVIPQQSYNEATKQPCLVWSIDTDARGITFSGSESVVKGILQVDCYSTDPDQPHLLAKRVRESLLTFSGLMQANTSPMSSVLVLKIFLDGENDLMDEEPGLYRVMQRYTIWYDES